MSELRARVISQEKGLYQISSGTEVKQASVSGKFRYEAQTVSDYPAVGDYVLAEWQEAGSPAIIRSLFPRKSCFLRKAAGSAKQEQVVADFDRKIEAASADYQELTRLLGEKEEAEAALMDLMDQWEQVQT